MDTIGRVVDWQADCRTLPGRYLQQPKGGPVLQGTPDPASVEAGAFPVRHGAAVPTSSQETRGMKHTLTAVLLAVCALPVAGAAQAQNPVTDGFRFITQRQAKNIVDAAEEMPADKYGFKPTEGQMTFGEVVAHLIGEGNDYLCSASSGVKAPEREKYAGTDPKDKLVAGLKDSFQFCQTAAAQMKDAQLGDSTDFFGSRKVTRAFAVLITVADWDDHYGQMATYLRLNGLLPPTAKKSGT